MIFLISILAALPAAAQEAPAVALATSSLRPSFVALAPNIHDFARFADGGPDSNWYIGFNNAWIVKLPPAPRGSFARAFIGAKIGRAKTRPKPNKPWVRELIDGKIYMGIAQLPAFSSEQSYFLTATADLPVEPDPQNYVDDVGPAEWFWAEVPLGMISFTRPNYLIVWSPTKYFTQASSAPILAAAAAPPEDAGREPRAWNNHSISGVPPRLPHGALETPLNNIYPALAIKLAPPGEDEVAVGDLQVTRLPTKAVVAFSVGGENVSEAWVESSRDALDWTRISRVARRQPFSFSIPADKLPPVGWYLRGAARDALGTVGHSEASQLPYVAAP